LCLEERAKRLVTPLRKISEKKAWKKSFCLIWVELVQQAEEIVGNKGILFSLGSVCIPQRNVNQIGTQNKIKGIIFFSNCRENSSSVAYLENW